MNKNLGQYYTDNSVAKLLIESFTINDPKQILEIGAGRGALLEEAIGRWNEASFTAIEIDRNNISHLEDKFPAIDLLMLNGLSSKLPKNSGVKIDSVDVAICNPPYSHVRKNKAIEGILLKAKLGKLSNYPRVSSDLIFLAQNLIFLRNQGELGIIVPDSLITSKEYDYFREQILSNHHVKGIIQLQSKIFSRTEAKTFILVISKGTYSTSKYPVHLYNTDSTGRICADIIVRSDNLIHRMDFDFHNWEEKSESSLNTTLRKLGVEITRGRNSKKYLKEQNVNFIHTSEIVENSGKEIKSRIDFRGDDYRYAESGDILMTRVGRTGLGSVVHLKKGKVIISDCVFRIRAPKHLQSKLFHSLNSEFGKEWIKAYQHGICAKVISMTDLYKFKL